ncbi:486_t:CDS:2, partial [Acaulospora morrowiae]
IEELTWNEELGSYGDYNLTSESSTNLFSLATYFPFWTESLPKDFATNSTKVIKSFSRIVDLLSKYPGSPPTTLIGSGQQWDFPNSWPPLNYVLIKGLLNFHSRFIDQGSDDNEIFINLARNLSQRYVDSVFCAWYST